MSFLPGFGAQGWPIADNSSSVDTRRDLLRHSHLSNDDLLPDRRLLRPHAAPSPRRAGVRPQPQPRASWCRSSSAGSCSSRWWPPRWCWAGRQRAAAGEIAAQRARAELPARAPLVPLRADADVRRGAGRPRRAWSSASIATARCAAVSIGLVRLLMTWSVRCRIVLAAPLFAVLVTSPDVGALVRHPHAGPVAHPEPARDRRVRNGVRLRVAAAPATRPAGVPRATVGAASRPRGRADRRLPVDYRARAGVRQRSPADRRSLYAALYTVERVVLDVRAPRHRRCASSPARARRGATSRTRRTGSISAHLPLVFWLQVAVKDLPVALEREVSAHPERRAGRSLRDLSPARPLHVHRRGAERPPRSARRARRGDEPWSAASRGRRIPDPGVLSPRSVRCAQAVTARSVALDGLEPRRAAGRAARGAGAERRR